MNKEFQEVEVIESNLLDPTKPTDYAEVMEIDVEFAIPKNLTQYFHNKAFKNYFNQL